MNRDSQNIFESYVAEAIGTQQGQAEMAATDNTVPAEQPAVPAPEPAPTQTEMLAGIIAGNDQEFLTQLFAVPAVQELMKSKLQPAGFAPGAAVKQHGQPDVPLAPAPAAPAAPAKQAIPGGELGNPPLQTP